MRYLSLPLLLAAGNLFAVEYNLIPNGNFEAGNTGFQSDYRLGDPEDEGVYKVVSQMTQAHSGIAAQFGNMRGVGGSGQYLFANGSSSTTNSPWKVTLSNPSVTVTTDINSPAYYRFEAMVANTDGPSLAPPSLSFDISVDGGSWHTFVYTPNMRSLTQTWTSVYVDTYFFTVAPTTVALRLSNLATDSNGNDFAIDNLYFGITTQAPSYLLGNTSILSAGSITNPTPVSSPAVPEPSTYGLIGLGALGVAIAARRRKLKTA